MDCFFFTNNFFEMIVTDYQRAGTLVKNPDIFKDIDTDF